ncbi:hypothetical protein GCM10020370_57940 [Paenibacillus hodogayensis]
MYQRVYGQGGERDVARLDLSECKRKLRREMGKKRDILGGILLATARGIDTSPAKGMRHQIKAINCERALKWSALFRGGCGDNGTGRRDLAGR